MLKRRLLFWTIMLVLAALQLASIIGHHFPLTIPDHLGSSPQTPSTASSFLQVIGAASGFSAGAVFRQSLQLRNRTGYCCCCLLRGKERTCHGNCPSV